MKKNKIIVLRPVFILFLMATGCQKEYTETVINTGIEFSIYDATAQQLKCTPVYDLNKARKIIITIQTLEGATTKYTSSEIDVYKMGDAFICEKLLLNPGSYKLTEFLVADSLDNIIFAAPLEGSEYASGVSEPLPVEFIIENNKSTKLLVEVLSTENVNLAKFGLSWFSIDSNELFYLQVAFIDKITGEPIDGKLVIFTEDSDMYSVSFELEADLNNIITIKKGLHHYFFEPHSATHYFEPGHQYILGDSLESLINSDDPLLVISMTNKSLLVDIDGNTYKTVQIGNRTWMAENLRTTHLNDNTTIHHSALGNYLLGNWCEYDMNALKKPAYCMPRNIPANNIDLENPYYNFYTVETGKLCPTGWHVPTESDWDTLISYVGGTEVAGDKLKDTIPESWAGCDESNATNEFGFTAVGSGYIRCDWENTAESADWWADGIQGYRGLSYSIKLSRPEIYKGSYFRSTGLKVRCIKDE